MKRSVDAVALKWWVHLRLKALRLQTGEHTASINDIVDEMEAILRDYVDGVDFVGLISASVEGGDATAEVWTQTILAEEHRVECRVCNKIFDMKPAMLDSFYRPVFGQPPEHEFPQGEKCLGVDIPSRGIGIQSDDRHFVLPTGQPFGVMDWVNLVAYIDATDQEAVITINKLALAIVSGIQQDEANAETGEPHDDTVG